MIFIAIYFISIHWGLELFGGFFPFGSASSRSIAKLTGPLHVNSIAFVTWVLFGFFLHNFFFWPFFFVCFPYPYINTQRKVFFFFGFLLSFAIIFLIWFASHHQWIISKKKILSRDFRKIFFCSFFFLILKGDARQKKIWLIITLHSPGVMISSPSRFFDENIH